MKTFLSYTAIIEGLTGLGLIFAPTLLAQLLFDSKITEPVGILLAMIGGAGIFAVALCCWLARSNAAQSTASKMILFYNVAVTLILIYGALSLGFKGYPVWGIIIFHAFQSVYGILLNKNKLSSPSV
jgi:hypothetical protein